MIAQLQALDIRLAADGARLRINAPKGGLSAALRQRIADSKAVLLDFLHQRDAPKATDRILRICADEPALLSFAQERIWFLEQLEPGRAGFNLCRGIKIFGQLNVAALEAGLNEIRRRHETLRTRFYDADGRARQRIGPHRPSALAIADLSGLSEKGRRDMRRRLIRRVAQRPFYLSRGPLLRAKLLRLSTEEHLLVLCTHHIVADAWSMGVLGAELWTHYNAHVRGAQASMPELPVQYRDYAQWQRESLDAAMQQHWLYWKNQLADAPPGELPVDRPRPARQIFRAARQPIVLSASLSAALKDLSRHENSTLFMTLLAGFQLLLHRYMEQDDIVVGTVVANRERRELEGLIGLFVNTLALRTDCSGEPSFRELLRRVRESCLNGYAHQDLPFEKIVEVLQPQRQLNRHPLFQAMFVLQNTPHGFTAPVGLRLEPMEIESGVAQLDLSLYLRERDGQLLGFIDYADELFDPASIERMAGHFRKLLQAAVAHPEQSIAALPMLDEPERQRILIQWNDTAADFPRDRSIHELFEAQAMKSPDAVAVESSGQRLSYRELNGRANQLARYLRRRGVGPQARVGILVDRSLEMVIGLLGILKAGGAYVPLDPAYPRERLRYMLEDAQVAVLITVRKLVEDGGWRTVERGPRTLFDPQLHMLCIDEDWQVISRQSDKNLPSGVSPDDPAYVIYTSGSTGTPKGVIGLHRGALNRFAWMWRRYPFGAQEICCSKTSLSFVDSVWEIFGPLLQGVQLAIAAEDTAKDPRRLIDFLAERRVTRIVLVPALLKALLDDTPQLKDKLPKLLHWTSSGEVLTEELAGRLKRSHPEAILLNLYGSSEVAGDVTCFEYHGHTTGSGVPIGRPIDNTQIYLLDTRLQPVPIGVTGELFVGGVGLARGYWNRPELSAKKFLADPFAGDIHHRLYRTGDLARYLPDGNIEYRGRADRQCKIRGQRVELGEIEATLQSHPAVRECAVITAAGVPLAPDGSGNFSQPNSLPDSVIVAYVVAQHSSAPNVAELRNYLKTKLPEFMLPSAFVPLTMLPSLPNGKLARRALPPPASMSVPSVEQIVPPRTEIEALVAQVWREELKLQSIDVRADFFTLGGHSLLGAVVVAKLRALFKRPVSLRDLFEAPTVESLSVRLGKALHAFEETRLPPILARADSRWALLTPSQEQLFLFSQLFGGGDFLNMPYAYRLSGALDPAAMERAIGALIERHEILRTAFVELDGGAAQRIGRRRKFSLKTIDLSRLASADAAARLAEISRADAARSFDLARAPLLRAQLIRMAEEEHVLLLTLHHLITDQWSMGVIRRELAEIYGALAKGVPASLPELPIQFGDFAAWQIELLKKGAFNSEIAYWRKQLAAPLRVLDFQRGKKRNKTIRFQSSRRPIEFDDELFAKVKEFSRRQRTTPFIIFITALDILLHKITGQRDIRIATLVADRSQPGTEGLIGYFVNALVLRTEVSAELRAQELLDRVRAVCLLAFAHQQVPFAHLETRLSSLAGGAPPFQVMLNYRVQGSEPQETAGLTIASWYGEHRAANPGIDISRLELNFHLREVSTRLTGVVNFRIDLFDEARIAGLLDGLRRVLGQLVAHPERSLAEISLR